MGWSFLCHIVKSPHPVLWGRLCGLWQAEHCLCFLFNCGVATLTAENVPFDASDIQEDAVSSSALLTSQISAEEAFGANNLGV